MAAQATPAVLLTVFLLARGATSAAAIDAATMRMAARASKAGDIPAGFTVLGAGHCADSEGARPRHCNNPGNSPSVLTQADCAQHCLDLPDCAAYEWGHGGLCELVGGGAFADNSACPGWNFCAHCSTNPVAKADVYDTQGTCYLRGAAASAVGDPHLENVLGQRFDLMQPGRHVLVQIPRLAPAPRTLLRVVASALRLGAQCGDVYFQDINITGAWPEAKHGRGSLHFRAADGADETGSTWMTFGTVGLKVVHGRTLHGVPYLNFYAKHLAGTGYVVGGLLGEDDHDEVATPDTDCVRRTALRVTS